LSHYGIDANDAARHVQERFASRRAVYGEHEDITPEAAAAILQLRA
jgi:hypothetical protein